MNLNMIEGGFLPRWLVFENSEYTEPCKPKISLDSPIPEDIVDYVRALYNKGYFYQDGVPKPLIGIPVPVVAKPAPAERTDFHPEALEYLDAFNMEMEALKRDNFEDCARAALYSRAGENARKIALILSHPDYGITLQDAEFACGVIRDQVDGILERVKEMRGKTTAEMQRDTVMDAIRFYGLTGATKTDIFKKTRSLDTKQRTMIINELIEHGVVYMDLETGDSKNTRGCKYFLSDMK
jgi:uncharacterized protein YlzI (FlbEa/FlbD family)